MRTVFHSRIVVRMGLLISMVCFAGGCTYVPTISTARRDAAFSPFRGAMINDVPTKDYLARRTALVFVGGEIANPIRSSGEDHQAINFAYSTEDGYGFGSAAIVDTRGYLLTAAHVVNSKPITVLYSENGAIRYQRARVVWNGYEAPGKPDLALLCVDKQLPPAFLWSKEYQPGETALAAGLNYVEKPRQPNLIMGFTGGKLDADRPFKRTETTQTITSDLPLHPGDSGGPLVNIRGQLIAINISVRMSRLEYIGIARNTITDSIRPDIEWLLQLIEQDYSKHAANNATKTL